jgi:hypothetical protein
MVAGMGREDSITLFRGIRTADRQTIARLESISAAEWDHILKDLSHLGLAPLFYSYASGEYLRAKIPGTVMQDLQELYFFNGAKNAIAYRDLGDLLTAMEQEGIRVIVLKGIYLAAKVYADIALRVMADIDILAKEEDLSKVENLLLGMGYGPAVRPAIKEQCRSHHHLITFTKPGSPSIEVHWTLNRISSGFSVDISEVWDRAKEVEISGCKALALSTEDLLLHLCLHFSYNHKLSILQIKNLCDVSEVIGRFGNEIDWERFVSITNKSGAGRFVCCTLLLTQNILGTVIPPEALKKFGHDIKNDRMANTIMDFVLTDMPLPLSLPYIIHKMETENRLAGRLKILLQSIYPPPSVLKRKYNPASDANKTYARLRLRYWSELLIRSIILIGNLAFRTRKANPAIKRRKKEVLINNWLKEPVK